jgi:hypothetical protein
MNPRLRTILAELRSRFVALYGDRLTWNCRHIDNAALRPLLRSVCAAAGYRCPEICTPLELLAEEDDDVPR